MQPPEVFVVRDHDLLLEAVGARLVTSLVDHINGRGSAALLIDTDPLITEVLARLSIGSVGSTVDWEQVSVWAARSSGRELLGATAAALTSLGVLDQKTHFVQGSVDLGAVDVSERYAAELRKARGLDDHGAVPAFDIALLTIGETGSVAGLHPKRPTAYDAGAVTVDPVSGEVTLTLTALSTAREVWLLGVGKRVAPGVHLALTGGPLQVPAAGARGQARTLVLLDDPAASALPSSLRRLASP